MSTARSLKKISRKFRIVEIAAISTLLIPKAGLNIQGIPLTINLFLVVILIIIAILKYSSYFQLNQIILLSFIIPWLLICLSRSNALLENQTLKFGSFYWFVCVPFLWVSTFSFLKAGIKISPKLPIFCSFGTTLFGIGQFIWGLGFLKISGVTIALGDSYERKNLSIFGENTSIGTKIPSTFQGGNIWGQCSALILIWVVVFKMWRVFDSRLLQVFTIMSPAVAVFLSFSRTAVFALLSTLFLYSIRDLRRFINPALLLIFLMLFIFYVSESSLGRYSIQSFTNSAGRTSQWSAALSNFTILDWVIGRSNPMPNSTFYMEGILGLFGQVGILGFILILFIWFSIFKQNFSLMSFALLICLILDSTYVTPPLLLVPSILMLAKVPEEIPKT